MQSSYFSVQPDEGLLLRLLHHQDGDSHGRRGQHALPLAGLRGRQGAAVAASGSLFGVFSGVCLAGFVAGTVAARFLAVQSTFQACPFDPRTG